MKIEMTKVLEYLKPKVKALGFKKDIIEGIAADIADNLEEVEDEASDEDINAVIKPAVDAVIPSLKLAQRLTNQGIEEFRKKQEKANEPKPNPNPAQEPEPNPEPKPEPKPKPEQKPSSNNSPTEDTPKWVKELIESNKAQMEQQQKLIDTLQAEVNGIKTKNTTEKRRAELEKLLKDTGTFGKRTFRDFEKMKFESDEDFEEYLSTVKEDLEQLNQERANEGLAQLGQPKVETKQTQEVAKPKPLSETEVEELAASM